MRLLRTGSVALPAAVLVAAALLAGCATASEPTDQQPRATGHTPAAGWRTIAFHGLSLDVPDAATLTQPPSCGGGLPAAGVLVVPLFGGGAVSCPAQVPGDGETFAPRPTDRLTVVLGIPGDRPTDLITGGRHADVLAVGARVTASGPAELVDAVLASIRVTPQDDHGCVDRIDPNVAPRNIASPDGSLLPVPTSRIVVCEYGATEALTADRPDPAAKLWLVASEELPADAAAKLDGLLRAAPTVAPDGSEPGAFGPVLRLRVLGDDGNTRTLQALSNLTPQPVTDGRVTVGLDSPDYPPVPTPV